MAASTRSRVSPRTWGLSCSTRETVWYETPAMRATSAITAGRGRFCGLRVETGMIRAGCWLDRPNVSVHNRLAIVTETIHEPSAWKRAGMTNGAAPNSRELWFLTGSQHLYGDETLEKVARNSQHIAQALSGKLPATVVWKPVLTGPDAILNVMLAANAAPECAGVVTWMHTFSPAK